MDLRGYEMLDRSPVRWNADHTRRVVERSEKEERARSFRRVFPSGPEESAIAEACCKESPRFGCLGIEIEFER